MNEQNADRAGAEQLPAEHPRLAAAMAQLDQLATTPVTEHAPIFDAVHDRLRDVLAGAGRADQS